MVHFLTHLLVFLVTLARHQHPGVGLVSAVGIHLPQPRVSDICGDDENVCMCMLMCMYM